MSSESIPAGNSNNVAAAGPNGDANFRRQSAVSLPKGAANARQGAAINFGSVHDQNAMLSSSPAAQPSSGHHLHGEKPTVFGSVAAHDPQSKKTTIGFAGGKSDAAAAAASSTGNGTPAKSMDFQKLFQGSGSPAPSQATASNPSASPSQSSTAPASAAPSTPQSNATAPSHNQGGARHTSSNLRPPSGTPHHPGARPFEPQRSPSAHQQQGSRIASQGPPHQQFHGHPQVGPQQPRSPHMASAVPMQPMQPMGGPWQHQQPMGYAPPQYGYHPGYGYQPPLSLAQGGRPPSFGPAASYAHHSPSHSFSNPMSPAARQFEPQQKRQSAAIRIVNPETQAAVDIQSIQRTPSASQKSTPAPVSAANSPSVAKASPAIIQPAKSNPVRMETQEAFLARR
ncbi:hypothetical protein [Sporisorium scitamineum]|uniref:Uncharacterized protein n=1 Tax=Sporisorium scitamineum TaxID=49012 RepID=A0A0F7RW70_9BASI|nr:hypothetical protein [Sporisorium scitamineum]